MRVRLPSLLTAATGGTKEVTVEAGTVQGAIDRLLAEYPTLAVHLYDESGELRPHVNVFHNATNIRWLESLGDPVADGDTLTVMQAVSGG